MPSLFMTPYLVPKVRLAQQSPHNKRLGKKRREQRMAESKSTLPQETRTYWSPLQVDRAALESLTPLMLPW